MYEIEIHDTKWPADVYVDAVEECIEEVDYRFTRFSEAKDIGEQSEQFIKLSEAVSALASWHRGYEYENGTLPWQRKEN